MTWMLTGPDMIPKFVPGVSEKFAATIELALESTRIVPELGPWVTTTLDINGPAPT